MPKEPEELVFSVWFKGKELEGTRAELRQLVNDVEESLSKATELCVNPPKVDRGNLSYDSVKDFFSQAYPDRSLLGTHATQLFNQLVSVARDGSVLVANCKECHKRPMVSRCKDNQLHSDNQRRFLINVTSLKEFAERVDKGKIQRRGFGKMFCTDLKALVEKL